MFLRSRPNAAGELVDEYALVKRREVQPDLVTPKAAWYVEAHYAHASAVDWSNRRSLTDWLANRPHEVR